MGICYFKKTKTGEIGIYDDPKHFLGKLERGMVLIYCKRCHAFHHVDLKRGKFYREI